MSADNWRVCPKCKVKHDKSIEASEKKLNASYGKVDANEFLKAKMSHDELAAKKLDSTLREDYEIGTDEDGEFFVSYGCSCSACQWNYEYNHKAQVTA